MKAERKVFGRLQNVYDPPDLIEIQTKSYNDFLQEDVPPLFIRITAAGILPARRRRRTAAEPCSARSSALILTLSILVP